MIFKWINQEGPARIYVGFWPGLAGVERGSGGSEGWEIVGTVGPDIHSEIQSISKNIVNIWIFVLNFLRMTAFDYHIQLQQ